MKDLSQLRQEIMGDEGSVRLDFSNPLHETYFLERFGGEEFLKSDFPAVYAAFIRTKEAHRAEKAGTSGDAFKEDPYFNVGAIGTQNQGAAGGQGEAAGDAATLDSNAVWSYKDPCYGVMFGGMTNITNKKELTSYALYFDQPESYCEQPVTFSLQDLLALNQQTLEANGECHCVKPDGKLVDKISASQTCLVSGMKQIVKEFHATAPKSSIGNNPLIVLYNRDEQSGEKSDYKYPDNKQVDNKVNTILPISGSFTVSDGFTPKEFSTTSGSQRPTLLYLQEGLVEYNASIQDLASFFSIDKDNPKKVNFSIPENWQAQIDLKQYVPGLRVKLNFSFFFKIYDENLKAMWNIPLTIMSLASGPYYDATGPTVNVPDISIRWGCFQKNTKIQMADGSTRPIKEIATGEKVASHGGRSLIVKSVVTGFEKDLVYIEAENGLVLEVTAGHPVAVERGIIAAGDLNAADVLKLADGTASRVKYLYQCGYDDTVYNLDTGEPGAMLIANGFLAGDLAMQNELGAKKKGPVFSEEALETARQLKELCQRILG